MKNSIKKLLYNHFYPIKNNLTDSKRGQHTAHSLFSGHPGGELFHMELPRGDATLNRVALLSRLFLIANIGLSDYDDLFLRQRRKGRCAREEKEVVDGDQQRYCGRIIVFV